MTIVLLVTVGLVAGALASSLGIGGGVVFVPVLAVVVGLDQAVAQGTSLAVIVPTAIIGTFSHARMGRVAWRTVAPIAIGGVIGGLIGAGAALAADPLVLRRLFAAFLVVVALRLIRQRIRTDRATDG